MGNVWHRSHAVFCVRHQPRSYRRLLRTFWWTKQNVLFGMLSDLKRERLGARVYQELRKLSSCRGVDLGGNAKVGNNSFLRSLTATPFLMIEVCSWANQWPRPPRHEVLRNEAKRISSSKCTKCRCIQAEPEDRWTPRFSAPCRRFRKISCGSAQRTSYGCSAFIQTDDPQYPDNPLHRTTNCIRDGSDG